MFGHDQVAMDGSPCIGEHHHGVTGDPDSEVGNGPGHREVWIKDPDGYTVVIASPDGGANEPR